MTLTHGPRPGTLGWRARARMQSARQGLWSSGRYRGRLGQRQCTRGTFVRWPVDTDLTTRSPRPQRCGRGDQSGAGRERNANRKARVRIAPGTDGVGQQHAIQPRMDNAIAGAQHNPAARRHKIRQLVLQLDIDRLRVGDRMTETLHDQVGRKSEAGELFQFVSRHCAGRVLRTDRSDFGFAIGAGSDTGHAASAPDHFLRQRKSFTAIAARQRLQKDIARRQA